MSTFDGHVKEFPDIQVDYFRSTPATARCRPLACFLSHVHSDHLVGLDTLRSPFVYCSAATRALVLKLEKYPCRINFSKGILEARKRTYKDLKHLLKPLPLDTPTAIELSPGNSIQVTLFDANHCPGSVMFLFENEHRAALYTGDTRLEPWFVNSLVRNPGLAEYVCGLRTLDTIYMDTTFLQKDVVFQTKADGLHQLLRSVAKYPADTVFYFRAWTFGYEEVWAALAKTLKSTVHVDAYKMGMYESLTATDPMRRFGPQFHLDSVAPGLVGFMCANTRHEGCLQTGDETARIHSCEKGTDYCSAVRESPVVWIRPIVCRLPRSAGEMAEVGAGGGGEDLNREAELEISSAEEVDRLCLLWLGKDENANSDDKEGLRALLYGSLQSSRRIPVHLDVGVSQETEDGHGEPGARKIEDAIRDMVNKHDAAADSARDDAGELPRTITFPYSRHSSYQEQCDLVDKLRPRDVWPCTVNENAWFRNGETVTIKDLFGQYCTGDVFRHDEEVVSKYRGHEDVVHEVEDSQMTVDSDLQWSDVSLPEIQLDPVADDDSHREELPTLLAADSGRAVPSSSALPYFYHSSSFSHSACCAKVEELDNGHDSQASALSELSREQRMMSHQAVVHNAVDGSEWMPIGLSSTSDNHTTSDHDLGHERSVG